MTEPWRSARCPACGHQLFRLKLLEPTPNLIQVKCERRRCRQLLIVRYDGALHITPTPATIADPTGL